MLAIPAKVREKIEKRLERDKLVVITYGKSAKIRIWGLKEYLRRKAISKSVIQHYKPWKKREKPALGPIGSKSLGAKENLSRTTIYEER